MPRQLLAGGFAGVAARASLIKVLRKRAQAQDALARDGTTHLLKRVFESDLERCPHCDGELKIIAAILERPVIEKILTHLGLQVRAPPRSPARGQALHAA